MSYDYYLLNPKKPISSHEEIEDDVLEIIDSNDNIRRRLASLYEDIVWDEDGLWGRVPNHEEGRLEFSLDEGGSSKIIKVLASHSHDTFSTIRDVAEALHLVVFDLQTLEIWRVEE